MKNFTCLLCAGHDLQLGVNGYQCADCGFVLRARNNRAIKTEKGLEKYLDNPPYGKADVKIHCLLTSEGRA